MSLIQCALGCRYQKDGYCFLDTPEQICSPYEKCPYLKKSEHISDSLMQITDADNLN